MDKIKFERDRTCYDQHSESFRSLNTQLWQVPIIAMTLTGGLWFGVHTVKMDDFMLTAILSFCGLCDIMFIVILFRVRLIMSLLLEKISLFNPEFAIDTNNTNKGNCLLRKNNLVVYLFSLMLLFAAMISFLVAFC